VTRPESARNTNDRIAEQAILYRSTRPVAMVCECTDPDCREFILISLPAYTQLRDGSAGYYWQWVTVAANERRAGITGEASA
jgi:hypothetical protein